MCSRSHWFPPKLGEFKIFEKCPAVPPSAHTPQTLVSLCILGPLDLWLTFCLCFILTPSLSHGLHQRWSVISSNLIAWLKQILGPEHFTITFFLSCLPVCIPHDFTESETLRWNISCFESMDFTFFLFHSLELLLFIIFIFLYFCLQYFLSRSLITISLSHALSVVISLLFFSVLTVSCLQLFS